MKAYLEPEDVKHLEEAAVTSRDRLLIRLLFRLACRISEALAICVGDVDFTRGTITILHLKRRAKLSCTRCRARLGKRHHFCPECGEETSATATQQLEHRRVRTLPLDSDTLNMLANFIETEAKWSEPLRLDTLGWEGLAGSECPIMRDKKGLAMRNLRSFSLELKRQTVEEL